MRGHRTSEHQAAVNRRFALLSDELAAVRASDVGAATGVEHANPWAAPATHTRLSAERREALSWHEPPDAAPVHPVAQVRPEPAPTPIPSPGRHARRRHTALLPEALRGRIALGLSQVVVVLVLVTLGLAATCWWLLRGTPREIVAPAPASADGGPLVSGLPTGSPESAATSAGQASPRDEDVATGVVSPAEVVVDVAGKVRRPGIAVLAVGSRVVDALEAAGGARAGVDVTDLNLARVLVDGEQILVGVQPATGLAAGAAGAAGSPMPTPGAAIGALVPLNSADLVLLETLPDVGPVTAQAIVSWRSEHGAFTSVDELLEVDGIGEATLARLAPLVTL